MAAAARQPNAVLAAVWVLALAASASACQPGDGGRAPCAALLAPTAAAGWSCREGHARSGPHVPRAHGASSALCPPPLSPAGYFKLDLVNSTSLNDVMGRCLTSVQVNVYSDCKVRRSAGRGPLHPIAAAARARAAGRTACSARLLARRAHERPGART